MVQHAVYFAAAGIGVAVVVAPPQGLRGTFPSVFPECANQRRRISATDPTPVRFRRPALSLRGVAQSADPFERAHGTGRGTEPGPGNRPLVEHGDARDRWKEI